MSRFNDAQFELVYAILDDIGAERGLTQEQCDELRSRVFGNDRLWDSENWQPLQDFVSSVADEIS